MKQESTKEKIIRKLTSRKLWAAICAFIALIMVAMGHTEAEAGQITAIVMAGAVALSYIMGEGMVDAAAAGGKPDDGEDGEDGDKKYGF